MGTVRPHNAAKVWLAATVLSAFSLAAIFLTAFNSNRTDLYETCLIAGQELDLNFRLQNPDDGSLVFPLHNRCNAFYDIVPEWTNPALVALAAAMVISLICTLVSQHQFTHHLH
jgi:hypothetical protein